MQLLGQRIAHVDDEHLPVGLALVDEPQDAERLDLLDVARAGDGAADLAGVERVVVAGGLGVGVVVVGVFPGLGER